MMTDFDFAGFLDTDNQKSFAISLIKLFDSIILEEDEEKILNNISEVKNNSISNDFGGLLSALSNFSLHDISSKLSLLAVINLITPNLSVSDDLSDQWQITYSNSKEIIRKKIDNFSNDYDLRYIAQISQWSENNSENAMIFQKIADLFHNTDNIEELRKKIQSHYPDDLTKLIDELDSKRTKGFVQSDIINILDKRGVDHKISSLVTLEAISQISSSQLSSDPLLEIKINEEAEPEIAFEVIELLPKIGIILTSTAGKDEGTFIFLVLCNNQDSIKMLDDINAIYKEYK
tara:strand:- start:1250 stop:2119 length:870 start_codon:yes stop_codon:yes gene_type:complete